MQRWRFRLPVPPSRLSKKVYIFDLNPRPADHNRRISNAGRASEEMRNVA